jgi:hypothetical protein
MMLLPGASARLQTYGSPRVNQREKEESPNMCQPIQLKNTTTPIARHQPPALRHHLVLITLALFFLAVCPSITCAECVEDTDGQIPFTVTRITDYFPGDGFFVKHNVFGGGRYSKNVRVHDLVLGQTCTFYRIKKTIFSHTGQWEARFIDRGRFGFVKRFKVNEDTNRVDIKIGIRCHGPGRCPNDDGDEFSPLQIFVNGVRQRAETFAETGTEGVNTLQQSQAPSPTELGVEAWLGDTKDPSGTPDSDRWFFLGDAGDSVIVRLEPDNKGGNNEGPAILRFIGPPTKQVSGKLPLRIDVAELGSTGRYDIEIEQTAGQGDERYRGGYILTIESAQGTIHGLSPTDSVEK